jgi:intracellular septation protein A
MTSTVTIERASRSPAPVNVSGASSPERPCLKSVIGRLAVNLWIACVIPALLFYLSLVTFNISVAVVVALGWSYGAIGWRWATKRRRSGLLALTVSVMTVRTIIVLATGDTFVYFFQPVVTDVAVGTVFLLSLASARPIVARLAADFYPMDLDLAVRPRIRQLFWRLTLLWALFCLVKGAISFWLLESQSTVNFVLIKNLSVISMTVLVVAATVQASVLVARKEGLLVAA